MQKNQGKIKEEEEFLKGTVRPDLNEDLTELCTDKTKTHYGQLGNRNDGTFETNIDQFLNDSNVDIAKDFFKGYFLHLVTDYYFYNKYFKEEFVSVITNKDKFHYDFDCLNKMLEEKFYIEPTENIKKYTGYSNGKPKYLNAEKLLAFIEKMSDIDLEKHVEIIKSKDVRVI